MNGEGQIYVLSARRGGQEHHRRQGARRYARFGLLGEPDHPRPRPGEKDGVDYHFVSREEFQKRIAAGEMAEHEEIFGNLYGTSEKMVRQVLEQGQDLFLDTDVNGAESLRKRFADGVFIFLVPPSPTELERRLRGRGTEDEDQLAQRLGRVKYELSKAFNATYLVVNDDLDRAVAQVEAIIIAGRCRTSRHLKLLDEFQDT